MTLIETKGRLLQIARSLFIKKGYEKTSVQDIISAAGMSKGGFYHHFAGKEDLLLGMAEETAHAQKQFLLRALSEGEQTPIEKMNTLFLLANKNKVNDREMLKVMYEAFFRRENLKYRKTVEDAGIEVTVELLQPIIFEGQQQGIFADGNPQYLADVIARTGSLLGGRISDVILANEPTSKEEVEALVSTYELAVDRTLGLPEGAIRIIDRETLYELIKVFA